MIISIAALYMFLITAMCSKSLSVDVTAKHAEYDIEPAAVEAVSPTKLKRGVFNLIPNNQGLHQHTYRPFLNRYDLFSFYSAGLQLNSAKRSQHKPHSDITNGNYNNQRFGVKSWPNMKHEAILSQLQKIQPLPKNLDDSESMRKSRVRRGIFNLIRPSSLKNDKLSVFGQSIKNKRGIFNLIPHKSASRQRQTRTFHPTFSVLTPNRKPPSYFSKYKSMYSSKLPSSRSKSKYFWTWNTFF